MTHETLPPSVGTTWRAVLVAPLGMPHDVVLVCNVLVVGEPERRSVTLDGIGHGYVVQLSAWLDPRDGRPRLGHLARERFELAAELAAEGLDPAPVEAPVEAPCPCVAPEDARVPERFVEAAPPPRGSIAGNPRFYAAGKTFLSHGRFPGGCPVGPRHAE